MKLTKRILSLVSAVAIVATMLSCVFTVAFADSDLDAELAGVVYKPEIKALFDVTNANNGEYIGSAKRTNNITAVSQNTYTLNSGFTFTYSANYNYGVTAFNHEVNYGSVGDLKFAIDMGVKNTESIKYKLYYGETLLGTYDTGVIGGTDDVSSVISGEWNPELTIKFIMNNGKVTINHSSKATSFGDITWTLPDNSTATEVALPDGYDFTDVKITLYNAGASADHTYWTYNLFLVKEGALTVNFPYKTVASFNEYLANVNPEDTEEVENAKFLRALAFDGTSAELQAAICNISENYGTCVHDYSYTTTATCTKDGVRTYVCSLCNDTYTEPEAALGHDYSETTANYITKGVCARCNDTYFHYNGREAAIKIASYDLDTKSVIDFTSIEFFVSDNSNDVLKLNESWSGKVFNYTLDGIAVTGTISQIEYVLNGTTVHRADASVGDDTYEFLEAGKYYFYGTLTNVSDTNGGTYADQRVLLGTAKVRDFIAIDYTKRDSIISYGKNLSLDDVVIGKPSTNAFHLKVDNQEIDTLYYGDTISANQWWKDCKDYTITKDGTLYKGYITKIVYRNASTGATLSGENHVWNGHANGVNGNNFPANQTGLWYVTGTMEGVINVETSENSDYIYNIVLGSFYVKTYQGDVHIHDFEGTVETQPTCTDKGVMHYTCECGEDDYYEDIPALGHNDVSTVTVEPTCSTTGVAHHTCTRCDYSYNETLAVVDHDYVKGYCRFCGIREQYTATAAEWNMHFVDEKGNAVTSINAVKGENFWMVVSLSNYKDFIGSANIVTDSNGKIDYANSTYDRTLAVATLMVAMKSDNVTAAFADGSIQYTTPYDGATVDANYDSEDGLLKVVFKSDNLAGCRSSISAAQLDANNGELLRIKLSNKLTDEGTINFQFVETSKLVSSAVALVNKPTAGEWVVGVDYTKELEMDTRCYDTIYAVDTVTAPAGPTYVEGLTIAGKNATFASDYSLMFAVTSANYKAYDKVYIKVKKAVYNGDVANGYAESVLNNATVSGNYYAYTYEGFAATEIASDVFATVYAEDANGNVFYGPETEYSLRSYAENQIKKANGNAKFKTMMVDFLNYGASAQTYFGYNTTDLANKNIDAYQNLATPERTYSNDRTGTDDASYAVRISAFNLVFKNKITILAATNMTNDQYASYKDSGYAVVSYKDADGKDIDYKIALSDENQFAYTSGKYCVSFNGLKSKEMSTVVTIALYDGNGTQISNSVTYSIETYASSKVNGTNAKLVALVKCMMSLGDSSAAYFAK